MARRRHFATVVPLIAAALALSACEASVEVGGNSVSASEIESQATDSLTKQVGQAPKSISCPEDLDAKVGESETCVLTATDGTTFDMTATITSVADETAHFDFEVAGKPNN